MCEQPAYDVQKRLFECISIRLPKDELLVTHVAKALGCSEDVAYSRIKGRSQLVLREAYILMLYFEIAPDVVCGTIAGRINFTYRKLDIQHIDSYKSYIDSLCNLMHSFVKEPNCKMYFLADEIPIFHYMKYPELTYFKLFTWTMDTQKNDFTANICYEEFAQQLDHYDLKSSFDRLHKAYLEIPSVEVWSPFTIDCILQSIEEQESFLAFSSKNSAGKLVDQVQEIWTNQKEWGGQGKKPSGTQFDFYCTRTPFGAGKMFLECDSYQKSVVKLYSINSMVTDNDEFNKEMKAHVAGVLDRATLIGASGRDIRIKFVRMVENKFDRIRERLQH